MLDLQTVCTLNHTKIFDDIFVVCFFLHIFAYYLLSRVFMGQKLVLTVFKTSYKFSIYNYVFVSKFIN